MIFSRDRASGNYCNLHAALSKASHNSAANRNQMHLLGSAVTTTSISASPKVFGTGDGN